MIDVIHGNTQLVIIVQKDSMDKFKELVQRGTNLWPDATPEIKHFADMVTNPDLVAASPRKRLQDYYSQDTSPKNRAIERRCFQCSVCHSDNLVDIIPGVDCSIWKCSHCKASNYLGQK